MLIIYIFSYIDPLCQKYITFPIFPYRRKKGFAMGLNWDWGADSIKDLWNDIDIEDTFKGKWDEFKDKVVDNVYNKTIGQMWDELKEETGDIFKSGCLAIKGSVDPSGCCKLNKVFKCTAQSLVEYGKNLKDLGGKAFEDGCEAIGGTVKSNDKWECDVDVDGEEEMKTFYGKVVDGSGSIATNVSISIII